MKSYILDWKIARLIRWIAKGSFWSFSFRLVCAALKREVLVVKLSRFHPRNVKEKRSKNVVFGKYRLGIEKMIFEGCS